MMEYHQAIAQIKAFVEEGKQQRTQTGQRNLLERIMRVAANANVLPFDAMFEPSSTKSQVGVVTKPEVKEVKVSEPVPKPLLIKSSLSAITCPVPGCGDLLKSAKALNGHMKKHRNEKD